MKYSLSFNDKILEGGSALEVFNQIKPEIIRGAATLTVKDGKKETEHTIYPFRLRKLMNNQTVREIYAGRF